MTEPEDTNLENAPEDYVSFGYLDPLFGRRIMDRLSRNHVRFTARDASFLDIATATKPSYFSTRSPWPWWMRHNAIELFVHNDDQELARQVIDEM